MALPIIVNLLVLRKFYQYGSKMPKKRRLIFIFTAIMILASCCLLWAIRSPEDAYLLGQYLYAPIEAPFCVSKIANRLNIEPTYPSIKAYIRENIKPGMTREDVHRVLEQISLIGVEGDETLELVGVYMCDSPLNNMVFLVRYSADGKLVSIEKEDYP